VSLAPISVESDVDLFADDVLADPYPHYAALRDVGPAAYLTRYDVWFLSRYDQVRAALGDWETFSSARGIGMTQDFNQTWAQALICVDPPVHTEQRKLFSDRLSARALKDVHDTIGERAGDLAERLLERGEVDAVADLAEDLPLHVIMDLIGWPQDGRDELLSMATGWFDTAGPGNARAGAGWSRVRALIAYLQDVVAREDVTPGGFGSTLLEAHKRGELPLHATVGLLAGYVVAAFDTTINAISSGA
jgi:cytochrome P450